MLEHTTKLKFHDEKKWILLPQKLAETLTPLSDQKYTEITSIEQLETTAHNLHQAITEAVSNTFDVSETKHKKIKQNPLHTNKRYGTSS